MIKRYLLFTGFCLLFFFGCHSPDQKNDIQTISSVPLDSLWQPTGDPKLDSLIQAASIAPKDTNLAMLYYQIGDIYENYDFDKAEVYYLKMGELCEQLDWNQGRYFFTIGYTLVLNRQGVPDSAITLNLKMLELAKKEKNELWIGRLAYSTGNAYLIKQWYETALNYYVEALTIFDKLNETERLSTVYFQLSLLYSDIGNVDKAIEFGEKSVALFPDDSYFLAGLGKAYMCAYQHEKANEYLEKSFKLCEQENNLYMVGWVAYQLCENALLNNDLKKAETYAHKAMKINKEIGCMESYAGALSVLSKVEELKGNFSRAEAYIFDVLKIVEETDNLQGKSDCYKILSELAIAQNKYNEHLQYLKELDLITKKIAEETSLQAMDEIEAKYETTKKELEIERQQNIINRQKIQRNLFFCGIALSVMALSLLWYLLHTRTRRNIILTEMNATKDKFFSIISHDLKNPALAQRDALQMMLDNAESWDVDTLKQYYHGLLQSANGQVNLLYNLLNWAQIQTGRMPFLPTQFDIVAELRKTDISLLNDMAKRKGIDFITDIPEIALITGDMNMLSTVVRNLLANAIKFTNQGGTVTLKITAGTGVLPYAPTRISVSDTGIGMTEEQIQNLFHLTRQISKRGTAGETGAGIGFIVCIELLEKHGVTLHVESKINEGSHFWFEI